MSFAADLIGAIELGTGLGGMIYWNGDAFRGLFVVMGIFPFRPDIGPGRA